jgi:hypothetical protein
MLHHHFYHAKWRWFASEWRAAVNLKRGGAGLIKLEAGQRTQHPSQNTRAIYHTYYTYCLHAHVFRSHCIVSISSSVPIKTNLCRHGARTPQLEPVYEPQKFRALHTSSTCPRTIMSLDGKDHTGHLSTAVLRSTGDSRQTCCACGTRSPVHREVSRVAQHTERELVSDLHHLVPIFASQPVLRSELRRFRPANHVLPLCEARRRGIEYAGHTPLRVN